MKKLKVANFIKWINAISLKKSVETFIKRAQTKTVRRVKTEKTSNVMFVSEYSRQKHNDET